MRHRKKTIKLNRNSAHRRALISNLVGSLIREEKIVTTLAKAKAAAPVADKMITLAKADTLAARRRARMLIKDRDLVRKLFSEIGPRYGNRQGGYTRVLKLSAPRRGDSAPRALLALVEEGKDSKEEAPKKAAAKSRSEQEKAE